MPRVYKIACSHQVLDIVCDALLLYAEMAFPSSGSQCSLVSNDALRTAVADFKRQQQETGQILLSRRFSPMLKAAIKTYYRVMAEQTGDSRQQQCELLLSICQGHEISDLELQQAMEKDRTSG